MIIIAQTKCLLYCYFCTLYCHVHLLGHLKVKVNWNNFAKLFLERTEQYHWNHKTLHELFHWWLSSKIKLCCLFLDIKRHKIAYGDIMWVQNIDNEMCDWLVDCEENTLDCWISVTAATLGGNRRSGAAGLVVVWSLIVGIIGSWLDMMDDCRVGCMVCGYRRVFLFRRSKNPHTKTGG